MAQLVKTVAGLAIASVKTINGLAIASVKTVAGLDNTSGGGFVQQQTQGNDSDYNSFSDGTRQTIAGSFVASSSYGLRKVAVRLLKTGSPTVTMVAKIYNNSANLPTTQTGSDSTTVLDATTITGSYASYEFTFPSDISLTNGTKYHVALVPSGIGDSSNYIRFSGNPSGTGEQTQDIAGTWSNVQSSMDASITTYSFS